LRDRADGKGGFQVSGVKKNEMVLLVFPRHRKPETSMLVKEEGR